MFCSSILVLRGRGMTMAILYIIIHRRADVVDNADGEMHFISFKNWTSEWKKEEDLAIDSQQQYTTRIFRKAILHKVGCHRNRIHTHAREHWQPCDHTFASHSTEYIHTDTYTYIYALAAHSPHYHSVSLAVDRKPSLTPTTTFSHAVYAYIHYTI